MLPDEFVPGPREKYEIGQNATRSLAFRVC